jgi:serine phosphatase RsbU (regulator of sigma subunit)
MEYCDHAAVLDEGDTLLLYTDGITEALSASGEAYGDDRLAEWLAASGGDEAAALVTSLVANVERFVDGAEASDDLTTLILCRKTRSSSLGHPSC